MTFNKIKCHAILIYKILIKPKAQYRNFLLQVMKLLWHKDHRITDVRNFLQSCHPVTIGIKQPPEASDHDFVEEQEKYLYSICSRTMALPVGR